MLKNYLKIALRNLLKYRLYTFINLTGLAIGIAACIMIMLFVKDEFSFDQYHEKGDRIYRAWVKEKYEGETFINTVTPFILGPSLAADIPEVQEMSRYVFFQDVVKRADFSDDETINLLDPAFFRMFDMPWQKGDPAQFGKSLSEVVLSEASARKYFGEENPLGKNLTIQLGDQEENFLVSGVLAAQPQNSSFQFDLIIPFDNDKRLFRERMRMSWFNIMVETFVMLPPQTDTAELVAKFPGMIQKALGEEYEEGAYTVHLQPFTDIHLNPDMPPGNLPVSDPQYAYILLAVAILILVIASINFTTLAVSRSLSRSMEVSVRKVVGAARIQLMAQFWTEAILIAMIALVLGVFLADLALPVFNDFAQRELELSFDAGAIGFWLGIALLIGLLSGAYPALILSGMPPVKTHKLSSGRNRNWLLRSMVAFQFVLSIFLISSTLIMQKQLGFLQNKNLGYQKEHAVVIPYNANRGAGQGFGEVYYAAENEVKRAQEALAALPEVKSATHSGYTLAEQGRMQLGHVTEAGQFRRLNVNPVDYNFLETMGIKLKAGRFFSEENGSDKTVAAVVNEAFVKTYGMENPIGQSLPKPWQNILVVGVVEDYHFASLHTEIEPLVLVVDPMPMLREANDVNWNRNPIPYLTVMLDGAKVTEGLKAMEKSWRETLPHQPFDYSFIDQVLAEQYEEEARMGQIMSIAAILAIAIACLGLFGIVAISVAKRTKEIGVRKILGASVADILLLLSKNFALMIVVAMVFAFPLAWYFMSDWLTDFAYRIQIGWLSFVMAGLLSLMIGLLTMSYLAIRAARSNPVKALRYE